MNTQGINAKQERIHKKVKPNNEIMKESITTAINHELKPLGKFNTEKTLHV